MDVAMQMAMVVAEFVIMLMAVSVFVVVIVVMPMLWPGWWSSSSSSSSPPTVTAIWVPEMPMDWAARAVTATWGRPREFMVFRKPSWSDSSSYSAPSSISPEAPMAHSK